MSYRNETIFANGRFLNGEVVEIDTELRVSFPVKQIDVSFIVAASQMLFRVPNATINAANSNVILRSDLIPGKDLNASILGQWSQVTSFNFTQPLMVNGWTHFWVDTLALVGGVVSEVRLIPPVANVPYTMCMKIVFHSV